MNDVLDDPLFTAEEAAAEVGMSAQAIYNWVHRGLLSPVGTRGKHKLYRLSDVFKAESTRDRSRRKRLWRANLLTERSNGVR